MLGSVLSSPLLSALRPAIGDGVGGISTIGADLAMWFDTNQAYKSSGGGIVTPDSILTYTAPSPKLVYGSDGLLGYAPHNLLTYSEQFDNAAWTKSATTISANTDGSPTGLTTADRLIEDGTSGFHQLTCALTGIVTGQTYTLSIYAKAGSTDRQLCVRLASGAYFSGEFTTVDLSNGAVTTNNGGTAAPVGNGWYRLSISAVSKATGNPAAPVNICLATTAAGPGVYAGDGTSFVSIWGAQLNVGPTALTYVPTTTAAVYSLPRNHNPTTGAALGVLVEEQRANLCLYSDDFTNAAWVKSNLTAAKTATGPDGVANSASTLTATAANATALQAITSTSAARITSMFVKRRTGTGAVEMTQDNGSTWTAVTVTAGWTRVNIATATAANPTVGIRIVTDTDAIDVDLFQHELGAFITSPIPTVASQVTRAADNISILTSAFPWNAAAGTMVVTYRDVGQNAGAWRIDDDSENNYFRLIRDTGSVVFDIVRAAGLEAQFNRTPATDMKHAAAWTANSANVALNGSLATEDTSVTLPTGMLSFRIGQNRNSVWYNGHIKRIAYYNTRKTNAELQVLSS